MLGFPEFDFKWSIVNSLLLMHIATYIKPSTLLAIIHT